MSAPFLSTAEKAALLQHVSVNQTGVVNRHFKASHVWEMVRDPQLYLLAIITIAVSVPSGVVTTYSATLLKNMGFSPPIAAVLNSPSGVISILSALIVGSGVRYSSHRWLWLIACITPAIIGGGLMSFMPQDSKSGLLAGIYLVNTVTATLPILYQWTAANVAGQTKRTLSMALISGSFSVGNIIGPQTFQAKDAPQYLPAKIAVMGSLAGAVLVCCVLFVYYVLVNRYRDRRSSPHETTAEERWANMTDNENASFRYVY